MSSCHSRTTTWQLVTFGQRVGEIGELVIVRREDRLRPGARVRRQVLGDRPREAQPVERRRAAADFVEDDQAARRRAVQDVGRLLHLDHERRLAARDVVGRADAREDAIDDRQLGAARRHERPGLRHQAEERRLPQVGRLAAHVRAGEDDRAGASSPSSVTSFGTNASAHVALDDGMAHVDGDELVAGVHHRLRVVLGGRRLGERREHVERGQPSRGLLDARRLGRDRARAGARRSRPRARDSARRRRAPSLRTP